MLSEVRKKESIQAGKTYKLLGVRWWGGGAFHREEKMGQDIKGKTLYQVQRGWIIYNRLFAFRGSFAYLDVDHEGAYVSNEFPTFDIEGGDDLLKRYIVHCLNSPKYLNLVDALSTGSTKTSRNRFNQRQFLDLNISVPTSEEGLKKAVDLLDRATKLRFGQDEILEKMKVLQESVGNLLPGPDNT